jgi:hypothetical protein
MGKEYIHTGGRERGGRKVDRAENMEIRRQGSHGIQTATRGIYIYIYIYILHTSVATQPPTAYHFFP